MANTQKSLVRAFLLLTFLTLIFLPSSTMFAAEGESAPPMQDDAPTPTPTSTSTPIVSSVLTQYDGSLLEAFIEAPSGVVSQPYVILDAIELGVDTSALMIKGAFSDRNFVCESVPCLIPFPQSDNISFRAYSESGRVSEDVLAVVAVEETDGGYIVQISSVTKYTNFADSCKQTWGYTSRLESPDWAEFPQFYFELGTQRTLHYLAAKLIVSGIVDVSSCGNGGVSADLTWPTGCGLEQARSEMIEWQNQFDPYIWTASKDIGIPPKIVKTLIQTESQFWPSNQRFYVDEYGLGQVTQLGLDVLLRDDPVLFQSFCPKVLDHCNTFYTGLSAQDQALVRGALLASLDASCPTCDSGFDITSAGRSVFYVARLLKADCTQVDKIVDDFGTFEETEYEDYWKFTLFTYHSGIVCFHDTVEATLENDQELTWENFAENIDCVDGEKYVDGIWGDLLSFDLYSYQVSEETNADLADPVFEAPPTPTPLPTQIPSSATVQVTVLYENVDKTTEPANDITVFLYLDDGTVLTQKTSNGIATFNMDGHPANIDGTVVLPGLYRSEDFVLPREGGIEVEFIFAAPSLPFSLP